MKITRTHYFDKSFGELKKSNPNILPTIMRKINELQQGKVRHQALSGLRDIYKIRVGKYRLLYTIQGGVLIILLAVRKREIAYKNLESILKYIAKK